MPTFAACIRKCHQRLSSQLPERAETCCQRQPRPAGHLLGYQPLDALGTSPQTSKEAAVTEVPRRGRYKRRLLVSGMPLIWLGVTQYTNSGFVRTIAMLEGTSRMLISYPGIRQKGFLCDFCNKPRQAIMDRTRFRWSQYLLQYS